MQVMAGRTYKLASHRSEVSASLAYSKSMLQNINVDCSP